eukprot:8513025-Pyramimonas_sp.AAC.1
MLECVAGRRARLLVQAIDGQGRRWTRGKLPFEVKITDASGEARLAEVDCRRNGDAVVTYTCQVFVRVRPCVRKRGNAAAAYTCLRGCCCGPACAGGDAVVAYTCQMSVQPERSIVRQVAGPCQLQVALPPAKLAGGCSELVFRPQCFPADVDPEKCLVEVDVGEG